MILYYSLPTEDDNLHVILKSMNEDKLHYFCDGKDVLSSLVKEGTCNKMISVIGRSLTSRETIALYAARQT